MLWRIAVQIGTCADWALKKWMSLFFVVCTVFETVLRNVKKCAIYFHCVPFAIEKAIARYTFDGRMYILKPINKMKTIPCCRRQNDIQCVSRSLVYFSCSKVNMYGRDCRLIENGWTSWRLSALRNIKYKSIFSSTVTKAIGHSESRGGKKTG